MSRIALESDVTLSSVHYMTTASDVRCQWYVSYLVLCSLLLVRRVCHMYLALIHFAPVEWSAGKIVSKVTYNMSTGMLNPAVAIHICCSSETVWYWLWSPLFLTLLARLIVVMKLQLDCPGAWILSHLTLQWLHWLPQSNGPLQSSTVVGTLAVDGWAVPPSIVTVPNVTVHPSTASVPTSYYSMWHHNCLWIQKD